MSSAGYGGGSLPAAGASGYDPAYGGIPQVPNPAATSAAALAANNANLAQIYQLMGGINTFNAGQAANQLQLNMPNYNALINQRSGLVGEELAGQVPQDVVDLLIRRAAERGIATGSPSSPNSNASYLKALGLTSLSQQQKGMADLIGAINSTPTAPLSDPSRMFITPDAVQQAQMAANLYASAPNPAAAARAARSAATVGSPRPAGSVFGVKPQTFFGGPPATTTSPDYSGDRAYGGYGPFENTSDDYANWSQWFNNLPGSGSTTGNWGGGIPAATWSDPYSQPDWFGAPSGTTSNTSWFGGGDTYSAPPAIDDGIDWGFWDEASNFDSTSSIYDPVFDVSVDPNAGGYSWDMGGWDPGY